MNTLCLLLPLASWTAAAVPVTYVSAGAPTHLILRDIGEMSGVRLEADAGTTWEPLVVRFANVPLEEAKSKIATALEAEWRREGDRHLLFRSGKIEGEQERRSAALREKEIREMQQAVREAMTPWDVSKAIDAHERAGRLLKANPGSPAANAARLESRLAWPQERAILKLVARIDPRDLAAIEPHSQRIFSTHPTRREWPLGSSGAQVITELALEHDEMVSKAGRLSDEVRRAIADPDMNLTFKTTPSRSPVAILHLRVVRDADLLHFVLSEFDEAGSFLSESDIAQPLRTSSPLRPEDFMDAKFAVPEMAREYLKLRRSRSPGARPKAGLLRRPICRSRFGVS
jgi:hypothetical protein